MDKAWIVGRWPSPPVYLHAPEVSRMAGDVFQAPHLAQAHDVSPSPFGHVNLKIIEK